MSYGSGRENCAMSLTSSPNVLPLKIDDDDYTSTYVRPKNNEVRRYTLGLDTSSEYLHNWVTVGLMEKELPWRLATA
jgi:hypothetical protein